MTKSYKVAGHVFNFTMGDKCPVWQDLCQYEPFEIEPDANPLFEVELMPEAVLPDVEKTLVYAQDAEPGETVVNLWKSGDGFVIETTPSSDIPVVAMMICDSGFARARLYVSGRNRRMAVFGIDNALMLMYAFRTITLGTLELHASMVSNSGRAFLFMARSGTGKSTHSRMWLENIPGTELMNDDNPVVRVWPDGRIVAYGTPWSGKTPCYRNVEAPVGAFVNIRRCSEDRITELSAFETYALIYSSSSGIKFNPAMADGLYDTLSRIVGVVPGYVMDCLPDAQAAVVCSSKVLQNV